MDSSINLSGSHYETVLHWKYDTPCLPDNKFIAERRLELLKKWLKRDPKLLAKYQETMEDYLSKGHARRVPATSPSYQPLEARKAQDHL